MLTFRDTVTAADLENVRRILASTGFFDQAPDEISVALELVRTALDGGNTVENYRCLFAEEDGETVGYVCFARVPCSLATFEIYWLAVDNARRGQGRGKQIIARALDEMRGKGAKKVVLCTAGRAQDLPTQKFYESRGFVCEARIKDYFAPGDDELVYTLAL